MDDALKIHKAGPWPMGFENDGASTSTWRAVTTTGTVTTTTTTTIVCGSFGLGVVLVAAWCGGIIGTGRICMHGGGMGGNIGLGAGGYGGRFGCGGGRADTQSPYEIDEMLVVSVARFIPD